MEGALDGPDLAAVVASARQIHELGSRLGDPNLAAAGILGEGRALVRQGRVAEGMAALDDAMVTALSGELSPDWAGSIYCHLIAACWELADLRRAREWVTATERWLATANATFEVLDAVGLPATPPFGAVFAFDAIHDQAAPATVLRRVYEAIVPGGVFVMVDINASSDLADNVDNPVAPMLYAISTLHCLTVSLAVGGAGLGAVWGQELARQMLADAGFTGTTVHDLPSDPLNLLYVSHRPSSPTHPYRTAAARTAGDAGTRGGGHAR